MALTIPTQTDRVISLEEYVEYVQRHCDPNDDASLCASSPMLLALANNRTFMAERLTEELESWRTFQPDNTYTSQTFTFANFGPFMVRANIWEPPAESASTETRRWHDSLFVYGLAHDHNFKFLTVGYHGSGYATKLYHVDPAAITGRVGERVPLEYVETTTLPVGKIMFYREHEDVHAQAQPAELSVSLNLLVTNSSGDFVDQHYFDLETSTLSLVPETTSNGVRNLLCRLAQHVGDERTVSTLEAVSVTHPSHRVRVTAIEALAGRHPEEKELLWRHALDDGHVFVRDHARRALELLGAR